MPRRRMISPDFWKDPDMRRLTRDERLLFIGCFSNADDEGRLLAHPAHLKASIFMYDNDLGLEEIKQLRDSVLSKVRNLILYQNREEEYLAFRKWQKHQKPSHPRPSDLPAPPTELFSESLSEEVTEPFRESIQPNTGKTLDALAPSLGQSSLGQSSLGKVSLGKVNAVQEDFTKFLDNEKDLIDRLTLTLTECMPGGRQHAMEAVKKLWKQAGEPLEPAVFSFIFEALGKYPIPILAVTLAKAVKYSPRKRKPANYIKKILEERMGKEN